MKTGQFARFVWSAAVLLGGCAAALAIDDFNEQRIQDGRAAFESKRFIEAIDQFRIAAFGSLDQPEQLSECLARMALAQAAAGQKAETTETLNRFVEVERRFGGFGKAKLEPRTRADFQALLLSVVPTATIASVPTLSGLVETDEQKLAKLPPAERRKAESGPRAAAAAPAEPGRRSESASATRGQDPGRPTASDPAQIAAGSKQALNESRRLIATSRAGEAVPLLNSALDADPGNRELRLALLEAACLSRSYRLAVSQVSLSAPFTDQEAPSLFYAAVALYETGNSADARGFLQRALPRVSGPLVEEYAQKILGTPR